MYKSGLKIDESNTLASHEAVAGAHDFRDDRRLELRLDFMTGRIDEDQTSVQRPIAEDKSIFRAERERKRQA